MKHTIYILVENHAGVLSKITGLFSRRAFNIESLAVGVTTDVNVSRITVVADGDEYVAEQIKKQLNKLIPVLEVKILKENSYISRELALIKVKSNTGNRIEIMKIAELMDAKVIDVSVNTITLQIADTVDNLETLTNLLKPYGIKEMVRTGTVAIEKGSNFAK
ncbi:acetolactate synthase small subunit [Oscillospiraceae bacterium LCP25S3_E10]|nr:acetolactate synthase small subunit [Ruminococcus sp.]MDD6447496.1 acetolactate synthase small subunit [Ruminococcus sp.]MDY2856423.1 acetolactate synthase small subunit [Oscillospiraceae bacterium]